ncbi:hypothetical protein SAMN05519226_0056 [Cycloclasticus pugetii]|nr:hypothetical protein SAMN05519226_0056 [Cycloclasticus pugetii]
MTSKNQGGVSKKILISKLKEFFNKKPKLGLMGGSYELVVFTFFSEFSRQS